MRSINWQAALLVWATCAGSAVGDEYRHTITIDGVNDFAAATEALVTTTSAYTAYTTWDNTCLYGGYSGPSIANDEAFKWMLWYMDTGPGGTTTGMQFGTQQPYLPFSANYVFAWRTDESSSHLYRFDGSSWVADANWNPAGNVARSGGFVEYRITLGVLGSPQTMQLMSCMVDATPSFEWTWAGMPANSFADGYNPNIAHSLFVDFSSSTPPNGTPEPATALLLAVVVTTAHGCSRLRSSAWRTKAP